MGNSAIQAGRGASQLLAAQLKERLRRGEFPAGTKLPTQRELANQTGLGYATVNRALSLLAQEGLVKQMPGAGTFACQAGEAPQRVSSRRIGVVFPYWASSVASFTVGGLFQGICEQADKHQHRVEAIYNAGDEAAQFAFIDKILSRDLDGLIWLQPWRPHELNLGRLIDRGLPVVATGRRFPRLPLPVVHENLDKMGQLVADYMIAHRRTKLIVMSGPLADAYSADRIEAIRRALATHQMTLPEENICVSYSPDLADEHNSEITIAVRDFFQRHKNFDFVFCLHPVNLESLVALHTSGQKRCPQDFMVVQMNQHAQPVHRSWPQLPMITMEWPVEAIGREAVRHLEDAWKHKTDEHEDLSPSLDDSDLQRITAQA